MAEIPRQDRAAIKSDIALSRDRLGRELNGLRYELDFRRKLKNSFRHSPAVWISALTVLGILVAVAPARTKKVYVKPKWRFGKKDKTGEGVAEAGLAVAAAKLLGNVAKPFLIKFITKKFGGFAGRPDKT